MSFESNGESRFFLLWELNSALDLISNLLWLK